MSTPLIIPFNHKPDQVIINNTSYTVPSGYYARASVISQTGWVILNGTTISVAGHNAGTLMSSVAILTSSYVTWYTVPNSRMYVSAYASVYRTDPSSGTATYQVRVLASDDTTVRFEQSISNVAALDTVNYSNIGLNPGDKVQYLVTNTAYNQANLYLYLNSVPPTANSFDLWLKSGDVIQINSGTGSLNIQLYKETT